MDQGKQQYPRPCPVCRTAMIGEKMRADAEGLDHFACPACGTTIELGSPSPKVDEDER
jgi:predicted RNA-binding Zn-ribbon protein involved in translation (DUF1610 family)